MKTTFGEAPDNVKMFKTQEDEDVDISIDKHPLSDDFQKPDRNYL